VATRHSGRNQGDRHRMKHALRRLLSVGTAGTATAGSGELILPRSGPEKCRRRKLLVSCRNSGTPNKIFWRTCKRVTSLKLMLGGDPILRRLKDNEVKRPMSAIAIPSRRWESADSPPPKRTRSTYHRVAFEKPNDLSSRSVVEVETASESTQRVHSRYDCLPLDRALWN